MSEAEGNWFDPLGETAASWDEVKNAGSMENFINQVGNMRSRLGNSIRIPSQEAGADDWSEFNSKLLEKVPGLLKLPDNDDAEGMEALFSKLGRPENHDGYDQFDGLPDLREKAFELGLSSKQYKTLMESASSNQSELMQAQINAVKESQISLKNEWGDAFEQRTNAINNMIKNSDAPEQLQKMAAEGALSGEMSKWLYGIVKQFGGEEKIINTENPEDRRLDPIEAMAQADEILKRMDQHTQGSQEYERLMHKRIELIHAANKGLR